MEFPNVTTKDPPRATRRRSKGVLRMPLPDLIEIVPLDRPVRAEITVPGSKSITNRALILAALGEGETTLQGALWSEDTQVMVECLQELGFMVNVEPDPQEPCNRTITVYGKGGLVPPGGTEGQPMELFVGNAGTAARFLAALVCLGKGVYRLHGVPRMHERPQAALFQALRELGYRIDSPNDKLPALVFGTGPRAARCRVSIEESSQFASALLLCAGAGRWQVEVTGQNAEESPYVAMTAKLIRAFPKGGGTFQIEPDASSASYFWAAGFLLSFFEPLQAAEKNREPFPARLYAPASAVSVRAGPASDWQVDAAFPRFLPLPAVISRRSDLGDSIMTAIVLAPFSSEAGPVHRPGPPARAGVRARRGPAHGAEPVRREGDRGGRYADGFSLRAPWRRDRDLRRPSHGDVLCNSGIESSGH